MYILYRSNTDCLWSPTILDDSKAPQKTSYDLADPFNFERSLALGEPWEDFLVDYLIASGLKAYRPKQDFPTITKRLFTNIPKPERKMTRSSYNHITRSRDLFTKLQRDILIVDPTRPDKRLCIELKARNCCLKYSSIDVGKVSTWDGKQFKVDALVVIDQSTLEAVVCPATDDLGGFSLWNRKKTTYDKLSYTVPRQLFIPLDGWVDMVKQGLYAT